MIFFITKNSLDGTRIYIISFAETGVLERLGYFERAGGNDFLTVVIVVSTVFVILNRFIISYISNWVRIWSERLYILNWRWHRLDCFHNIVTLEIIIRMHCFFLCIFCYERINILTGGPLDLKEYFGVLLLSVLSESVVFEIDFIFACCATM